MEARAIAKYIRMSPRKIRRVADLIKGKKATGWQASKDSIEIMGGEYNEDWAAVVDGVPGPAYEGVLPPVFSPDGSRVGYAAVRDGKQLLIVDGQEGKPYDEVSQPRFGPASMRVRSETTRGSSLRTPP